MAPANPAKNINNIPFEVMFPTPSNFPKINEVSTKTRAIIVARMVEAKTLSTLSMPIFPNIATRAANTADNKASIIQDIFIIINQFVVKVACIWLH